MPRTARKKDKNRPHHIMSRSIPELNLFTCNEDKEYYLSLMKTAAQVYRITIIAYCLMDNHTHLMVHPYGGNISKFMKNINNIYAKYYNRTYDRRGHLYEGRFKNIIIKDEVQLLRTSTYIHNNPKSLLYQGYKSIEDYPYSSIKDFLKPSQGRGLANPALVFEYMSGEGAKVRNHYRVLLELQSQGHEAFEKELEEAFKKGGYKSDKEPVVREVAPEKVLSVLAKLIDQDEVELTTCKYSHKAKEYKSLAAICLRIFSDMTTTELGAIFKGYTSSSISYLSRVGYDLMEEKQLYIKMVQALSL